MPSGPDTERAVSSALQTGYRLIDTARYYANEKDVGKALRASGIPREQVFVTTKLWNGDHGYDSTLGAFDNSLKELGLDFLDLYLIHWPVKGSRLSRWQPLKRILDFLGFAIRGSRLESWKAMEKILSGGRCRAIGASNYTIRHLEELLSVATVIPAVNQVEFTPFCYQKELRISCRSQPGRVIFSGCTNRSNSTAET